MHIVFLCDDTTKKYDANLTICRNLAKEFVRRGYTVTILGNCENKTNALFEMKEDIRFCRFYYPINRITHAILDKYRKKHSLLQLAMDLLCHPIVAVVDIVRALTGFNPIEQKYVKMLAEIHKTDPVSMAIACGGSFYTIHALAKSKLDCKKIGYMLDPYWKNYITGGNRAKREEMFAWKMLDYMVVPPLLKNDYFDPSFTPYRHKLISAEFPGIDNEEIIHTEIEFDNGKTNLLFTGNFYANIRSPEYLIALLKLLPDYFCLHILGGVYGHFDDELIKNIREMESKGRLILHGTVPSEEVKSVIRKADFLVNIGNTVENQLPSKIFEYFSSGIAVIHFQKLQNCPCVPYMNQYGNALILSEQDDICKNRDKLVAFCKTQPEQIPYETVKKRFPGCSVGDVSDIFLNVLQ